MADAGLQEWDSETTDEGYWSSEADATGGDDEADSEDGDDIISLEELECLLRSCEEYGDEGDAMRGGGKQCSQEDRRRQLENGPWILQLLYWFTCCFALTIWSPRASSATSEMLIRECM